MSIKLSTLAPFVVPGQPTNFQVGEVSDTSVELTWEPAFEKEGIISYELHYREGRQESQVPSSQIFSDILSGPLLYMSLAVTLLFSAKQVKKTFGPTSSYVVEGLRANTEYFFSLAAVSNKGIGAFTNEISQRTSQASM